MPPSSSTKTSATNHTGWSTGDGRDFNDSTCRSVVPATASLTYYSYSYGFSLPAGSVVHGIRIRHHVAFAGGGNVMYAVGLCNGAVGVGGSTGTQFTSAGPDACGTNLTTHGGPNDKWGLSQTNINLLVADSSFGVRIWNVNTNGTFQLHEDGFEVTVYYSPPGEISVVEAANHSGWNSGDGRIFDDSTCRTNSGFSPAWYYAYGYTYDIPEGSNIDGIEIRHHLDNSGAATASEVSLCDGTSLEGTAKATTSGASGSCNDTLLSHGGSTDKWGLSQSEINTLVDNANFGAAVRNTAFADTFREDGFEITIYYTEPTDEEETRRSKVAAVEVAEFKRRATVGATAVENYVRRAIVAHEAGEDIQREAMVWVLELAEFKRRSTTHVAVTAPDVVREAEVTIQNDGYMRRAEVTPELSIIRRAKVTTDLSVIRRAQVTTDLSIIRRATVTPGFSEDLVRRVRMDVAGQSDRTRRSVVYAAVIVTEPIVRRAVVYAAVIATEPITRRSKVTILNAGYVREALVTIHNDGYLRRSTVSVAVNVTEPITRRSKVAIKNEGYLRRSHIKVGAWILESKRRSRVYVARWVWEVDDNRRSIVTVPVHNEDKRRAELYVTRIGPNTNENKRRSKIGWIWVTPTGTPDIVRRASVYVTLWVWDVDDVRRSTVRASPVQIVRRSTVTAFNPDWVWDADIVRRASVYVYPIQQVRRSIVTVFNPSWIWGVDIIRQAKVFVPQQVDITRRAELYVDRIGVKTEDYTRRSILWVYESGATKDVVRRARVYVSRWVWTATHLRRSKLDVTVEVDTKRRASLTVPDSPTEDEVRRAIVFVGQDVTTADIVRRASVYAATWIWSVDDTRRSVVYSAVEVEVVRRSTVTPSITITTGDMVRRSIVTVGQVVTSADYTRRSSVTTSIWIWGADRTRRSQVTISAIILTVDLTRRASVRVSYTIDIVRRSIVYVGGHNTIHDTRTAMIRVAGRAKHSRRLSTR